MEDAIIPWDPFKGVVGQKRPRNPPDVAPDPQKKKKRRKPPQRCEHGRRKSRCKDCGGSQICAHGRLKYQCKECGGFGVCVHRRLKDQCRDCGGSRFCEHDRRKNVCRECGGSRICEHGRDKGYCKECGGSQICEHKRVKHFCVKCGGSQICEHGRSKRGCKDCKRDSGERKKMNQDRIKPGTWLHPMPRIPPPILREEEQPGTSAREHLFSSRMLVRTLSPRCTARLNIDTC